MPSLIVRLEITEIDSLATLAKHERRKTADQAALLIRRELQRLGLLPADPAPAQAEPKPEEVQREAAPV